LCAHKYTGSNRRVLTYFGFPVAHEDAAVRVCQAALDILAGLDGLNAELLKNGINPGAPVAMRLGMHVGSVVIGEMGGGNRTETLALGDTPNIVARMESVAPNNGIAITPSIKSIVSTKFELELLECDCRRHPGCTPSASLCLL